MKTMLLTSNDKLGRKLLKNIDNENVIKVLDKSSSFQRIQKLLRNGRIQVPLLAKMFFAELARDSFRIPKQTEIFSNRDLEKIIDDDEIDLIVMFRVGLIINKRLINSKAKIINVHCARLPQYGGLGAIDRALKNRDFHQEATMYFITEKIDSGEVIATQPFLLDPSKSYAMNENSAYEAGIQLIMKRIDNFVNADSIKNLNHQN